MNRKKKTPWPTFLFRSPLTHTTSPLSSCINVLLLFQNTDRQLGNRNKETGSLPHTTQSSRRWWGCRLRRWWGWHELFTRRWRCRRCVFRRRCRHSRQRRLLLRLEGSGHGIHRAWSGTGLLSLLLVLKVLLIPSLVFRS